MANPRVAPMARNLQRFVAAQATGELTDVQLLWRFVTDREQDAFAALVRRHQPLVWAVCRRVTCHTQDAEDAFQAVFLALAQRAGSIRQGESVGGWLYQVACRIAMKAKTKGIKREQRERRAAVPDEVVPADLAWRELQAMLDEEVGRLPAKYREPFVLCCLEGRGRKEAATELGWKEGTVSSRIAEARRRLQERLAKRGVTLSAALTAGELWRQSVHAAPPAELARQVIAAAGGERAVSAAVLALARGAGKGIAARVLAGLAVLMLGLASAAAVVVSPTAEPASANEDRPEGKAKPAPKVDAQGDPLPADALARLGTIRFRPGGHVRSLEFTPDGRQIVSFGHSCGVHVWDAATGREIAKRLSTPRDWIPWARLSKDGKSVFLTGGTNDGMILYQRRLPDLQVVGRFDLGKHLDAMSLSPDGKLIVGSIQHHARDYSLEIWDVEEGKRRHSFKAHTGYIRSHAFTPDGKTLLTGGDDKVVRFWDVATGAKKFEISHAGEIVGLIALSGDGTTLATVGMTEKDRGGGMTTQTWNPRIRVWDVASRKETSQLDMPARFASEEYMGFTTLRFAADGKTLISGGHDGLLRFWDVAKGKQVRQLSLGTKWVYCIGLSPDGKTIALGADSICLIDAASGKDKLQLEGHRTSVLSAALLGDGRTVVTAGGGSVMLWDLPAGRRRQLLVDHGNVLTTLHLMPDRRTLLGMDTDKTLLLWDTATGRELRRVRPANVNLGLYTISQDGRIMALPGSDKSVVLIDLLTGKEVDRVKGLMHACQGAALTADGGSLVAWDDQHAATVWDVKSRKQVRHFEFAPAPTGAMARSDLVGLTSRIGWSYGAEASPDGRLLAYGSQSGYLAIHDVATGKPLHVVPTEADGACAFAFTSDSRMLAWAGWREPTIHLLEVATGKERRRLVGHKGRVVSLNFSADGRTLVSGSEDTTAIVWDLVGDVGKDLAACWADLADADAGKAFGAMRRLLGSPAEAVPYLGKRIAPVPAIEEKRLAQLITGLGSDAFADRENATKELEQLGESSVGALRKALADNPPLETRRRLERLLKPLAAEEARPSAGRLRQVRCVEVLERMNTAEARQLLKALAAGAPGVSLTRDAAESLRRLRVP